MKTETPCYENAMTKALAAIDLLSQGRQNAAADFFSGVQDVVVIASSSRGGSSIFTEILRQSPELVHFKGEINPFLSIAGLTYPNSGKADESLTSFDAGPHNRQKLALLEREMALDAGFSGPIDLNAQPVRQRFLGDLLHRIAIQWPELDIDPNIIVDSAEATLADLWQNHGWKPGGFNDQQLFHTLFLARLRNRYPAINPHYYDLDPGLIRRYCPDAKICPAPPAGIVIEEPPFVLITPRHPAPPEMLARQPLILKTPSNVYRLAFLRSIFHTARFRVLHLVRNPADSINGLVDGWLYHGFFSHPMPERLNIKGYSDRFPGWGTRWWKYDLPPGWQQWTNHPLEYVCGYQWRMAHQTILEYLEQTQVESLRIAFEDVIGPIEGRRRCFTEIANWLGIEGDALITAATGELPPVMTTASPRQRRWFKKAAMLKPVLHDPMIIQTANRLGYENPYDYPE